MRIILINLARATGRLQTMQTRLAEVGLEFERLEATDGAALSAAERARADDARRRRHADRPLTDNEIACFISHRRAMARLRASGEPMAAIFEDDLVLAPDLPRVLAAIAAHQAGPFDVIDLFHSGKRREAFVPCRPLLPDLALGRMRYTHMGANGYVISNAGAGCFLAQTERFADEVDRELHRSWVNGLDVYALERPAVFHVDGGVSLINETRAGVARYADAGAWRWKLLRAGHRFHTTIAKRLAFPIALRRGRQAGK